jgi:hypothetical protein
LAWQLSRAVLRCQRRRALDALRAAPLPGALALAAALAAPFASWRVGQALASELQPVLRDPELARLLTIGPAVAGATAGGAVCVTTAGRCSLGPQLTALPVGDRAALAATVLVARPARGAGARPAVRSRARRAARRRLARRRGRRVGFVAGGMAGAAAGAASPESVLQAWARAWRRGAVSLLLPRRGLDGEGARRSVVLSRLPHRAALAGTDAAAALAGRCWQRSWRRSLARAGRAPPERVTASCILRRRSGPLATALPLAAAVLLARRRDLRLAVLAAVGFGLGGVVVARRAGVGPAGPLHSARAALLGAALVPCGRRCPELRPLGSAAGAPCCRVPPSSSRPTRSAGCPDSGSRRLALSPGAPCALAESVSSARARPAAVLAGALVPWRGATMGDQVASAAFARAPACCPRPPAWPAHGSSPPVSPTLRLRCACSPCPRRSRWGRSCAGSWSLEVRPDARGGRQDRPPRRSRAP